MLLLPGARGLSALRERSTSCSAQGASAGCSGACCSGLSGRGSSPGTETATLVDFAAAEGPPGRGTDSWAHGRQTWLGLGGGPLLAGLLAQVCPHTRAAPVLGGSRAAGSRGARRSWRGAKPVARSEPHPPAPASGAGVPGEDVRPARLSSAPRAAAPPGSRWLRPVHQAFSPAFPGAEQHKTQPPRSRSVVVSGGVRRLVTRGKLMFDRRRGTGFVFCQRPVRPD